MKSNGKKRDPMSQLSFGAIVDRMDALKEKEAAEELELAERFEAAAKSALVKLHERQRERREKLLSRAANPETSKRILAYLDGEQSV